MKRKVSRKKQAVVRKTVKARFSRGVLKPFEPLRLQEGEEVTVTVASSRPKARPDWLERTAGAWKETVDAEKFIRDIYESRLVQTRPVPQL